MHVIFLSFGDLRSVSISSIVHKVLTLCFPQYFTDKKRENHRELIRDSGSWEAARRRMRKAYKNIGQALSHFLTGFYFSVKQIG